MCIASGDDHSRQAGSITALLSRVPHVPESDENLIVCNIASDHAVCAFIVQEQRAATGPWARLDLNDLANLDAYDGFDDPSRSVSLRLSAAFQSVIDAHHDDPRDDRAPVGLWRYRAEGRRLARRHGRRGRPWAAKP